jgi:hypothetical protein
MSKKDEQLDVLENFNNNLDNFTQQYPLERQTQLDETQLKQTVIKLATKIAGVEQISVDHALLGICSLFQSGAHLKSVTNRIITIGGKQFTKRSLVFAYETLNVKFTFREIARYLNKTIAEIAYRYNIPGNLYARFRLENANLIANNSLEENKKIATYCTDFQIENPDTPPIVREFLASREKIRNNKKSNK